jgi:hypothetical protein
MSDTTNIDDLPSNDQPGSELNNQPVQPQQYQAPNSNNQGGPPAMLSPEDINKIVSGIQEASKQNQTGLPVRDIPMVSSNISQDPNVNPNYIPGENSGDYIQNQMSQQQLHNNIQQKSQEELRENDIFEQYKTPIIISILFLLFQMPMIDKKLYKFIPSLFSPEKALTFNGFIVKAVIFGGLYFGIIKGIDYFM